MLKTYPLWVSHSSIGDFLTCPRLYYLHHIHKNPLTRNKITIINPSLALGQAVHETIDRVSHLKTEDRFKDSLLDIFETTWVQVSGEKGGFKNIIQEEEFKERGKKMIQRVIDNPGPLLKQAVKLLSSDELPPRFLLSKEEDILLCGKIDWLEYVPEDNSVHIIDFKTGKNEEKEDSLQLPIYYLLVKNCQNRNIHKASYWYLDKDNTPIENVLPDYEESYSRVLTVAVKIKKAKLSGELVCYRNGCFACNPYEAVLKGEGKLVGNSGYQDIYIA